jgi:hypothetical protein
MSDMGYKLLGFLVWRGGKWYLRRRMPELRPKLVVGGLAVLVVAGVAAGVIASQRSSGADTE